MVESGATPVENVRRRSGRRRRGWTFGCRSLLAEETPAGCKAERSSLGLVGQRVAGPAQRRAAPIKGGARRGYAQA